MTIVRALMLAALVGAMMPMAADAQRRNGKAAGLKGNPGQFFGTDAYPTEARRMGAEGRVVTTLNVDATGAVVGCTVRESSGSASLDEATCSIALSKVRFTPATDRRGKPIASEYPLSVRWALEDADLTELTRTTEVDVSADGNAVACRPSDAPTDRRCSPDIAGLVAVLPKDTRPYVIDVLERTHIGDVPAADQTPPPGADIMFMRVAKVFVNEVGKVIKCVSIARKGMEMVPDCPTNMDTIGIPRGEGGQPRTTWAVIAFIVTKRPQASVSPAK